MPKVKILKSALKEIREHWEYLDERSPQAAERFLGAIDDLVALLGQYPKIGHKRHDEDGNEVWLFTIKKFKVTVAFRRRSSGIQVVKIYGKGREIKLN